MTPGRKDTRSQGHIGKAMQLVILFGLVSLFGDIVYEGARSVNGPYLKVLGANAALVGLIAGAGEFLGYGVRFFSGYVSDKTKSYWFFVFVGYALLISVPLMALASTWRIAALFILCERLGKAVRSPARDTILSQATQHVGSGFAFGFTEALDQIGALCGPLIFVWLFYVTGVATKGISDYQRGYHLFWFPLALLMLCVFIAYKKVPHPEQIADTSPHPAQSDTLGPVFWLYTLFSIIATVGFVSFVLVGYHLKNKGIVPDAQIPLYYAIAMAVDGVAALAIGKAYDALNKSASRRTAGLATLIVIPVLSAVVPFFLFTLRPVLIMIGVVLWGIIMGAHETIMKSAIADLTPLKKRGTGYGIFNTGYGLALFLGSVCMGFLYDRSLPVLIACVVIVQVGALVMLVILQKRALQVDELRVAS